MKQPTKSYFKRNIERYSYWAIIIALMTGVGFGGLANQPIINSRGGVLIAIAQRVLVFALSLAAMALAAKESTNVKMKILNLLRKHKSL